MGLALVLSFLAGPSRGASALRPAADATTPADCQTSIKNVQTEADAKKWDPPAADGTLIIKGSYDTTFNTSFWSGAEFVALKIKLTVKDTFDNKEHTAEVLGSVKAFLQKAKKVSKDDNDVVEEAFKVGGGPGIQFSGSIDLAKAILDATRKIGRAGGLIDDRNFTNPTPESVQAARALLKTEAQVFLGIHMGGTLHSTEAPCPKRWHGEVKLAFDDKGNVKKPQPLAPVDEPGGMEPLP